MASTMSSALRSSKRLLRPAYSVAARGISSTARDLKAVNFNMPALSPTMTEGTITSWRINEGDKFSAGDVILEVETDKAQMDVEAQDDGILAKIFVQASKDAVQVGTRIGVLADIDDDLSTLQIPAESSPQIQESTPPPPPQESNPPPQPTKIDEKEVKTDHKPRKNPFIPTPGLIHLLHSNNLQMSQIPGTGPHGRVLKGDILAHLGKIHKEAPKSLAADISKRAKLDLSNIIPKKPAPAPIKEVKKEKKVDPLEEIEVSVPISLSDIPPSAIAKAAESANTSLPPSQIPPTPAELFDEILGLPSSRRVPTYTLTTAEVKSSTPPVISDLFDEILGLPVKTTPTHPHHQLKLKVPAIDRPRAEYFLSKVKSELERTA
ncbi:pyridoxine biosynthesis protein [Arthrobotrys musiformis]|uniref:Pyridoxine biosynthesis protein n=1 Tax=Arthrobotrys musiformis TaxID=47236 RepID=A0AAV9W9F1_9PEZI